MSPRLIIALLAALVPAVSARAIIVYDDQGRLTTMPVLSGSVRPGWQYIGNSAGLAGVPIGPRAWITATHVTGTGSTLFYYDNAGSTAFIGYYGTRAAVSGDLAVLVLDEGQPDFQQWATVWSGTDSIVGQDVYMYGYGRLRGGVVTNSDPVPGTPKGWYWGDDNFALSYGTNRVDNVVSNGGSLYFRMAFDQPTVENGLTGEEGMYSQFDSGGGVFSFNPATSRWELIGINSYIDAVSETAGAPEFYAALYDTRGFYEGTELITGTAPLPLSSFATALPYQYEFLAPYIALPEPSAGVLTAIAVAGLVCARVIQAPRRKPGVMRVASSKRPDLCVGLTRVAGNDRVALG